MSALSSVQHNTIGTVNKWHGIEICTFPEASCVDSTLHNLTRHA